MTKETMIWQALSMIIAGMVNRKDVPATKELFEEQVIADAQKILVYSTEEIKEVLYNRDCLEFAKVNSQLFHVLIDKPELYKFGKEAVSNFLAEGCPNFPKDERGSWLKWYDGWFLKNQPYNGKKITKEQILKPASGIVIDDYIKSLGIELSKSSDGYPVSSIRISENMIAYGFKNPIDCRAMANCLMINGIDFKYDTRSKGARYEYHLIVAK